MNKRGKPQTEKIICKNCGLPFQRLIKKASKGRLHPGVRHRRSVTCSRECAREWSRNKCRKLYK